MVELRIVPRTGDGANIDNALDSVGAQKVEKVLPRARGVADRLDNEHFSSNFTRIPSGGTTWGSCDLEFGGEEPKARLGRYQDLETQTRRRRTILQTCRRRTMSQKDNVKWGDPRR